MKHHILPKPFKIEQFKVGIEKCMYSIKRKKFIVIDDHFKNNLKFICAKFTDIAKRACSFRNDIALHRCFNSLSKDRSLRVCKPDRGNGIAILNSDNYKSKLERIISNKTEFSKVIIKPNKLHPVISKEKSIEYAIRKYLTSIDKDIMQSLIPAALEILIPFPTTYLCEATMSALVNIKTTYRNRLRVANDMRIGLCNINSRIDELVSKRQEQRSH